MPKESIIEPLPDISLKEINEVSSYSELDILIAILRRMNELEGRVREIINVINMGGA